MRLLILIPLALILACKGKNPREIAETQPKAPSKTDTTETPVPNRFEKFKLPDYKIHTQQTVGNYAVSIWQNGSDNPPYFLLIENSLTHKKDTLELTHITSLQNRKVEIDNLTKKVAFPALTLSLTWEGESDNEYSEVVGYQHDTLRELFNSPAGYLVDLKRKDQWTLQGHVSDKDDIVGMPHEDYIITVSLKDFATNVYTPDTLSIDYSTKATDTLYTYQISPAGKKVLHTILPGTDLHIDTFYSRQHLVSLHLKDSTRLLAPHDELAQKVKGNDAG